LWILGSLSIGISFVQKPVSHFLAKTPVYVNVEVRVGVQP
jgi:hypothetical protein